MAFTPSSTSNVNPCENITSLYKITVEWISPASAFVFSVRQIFQNHRVVMVCRKPGRQIKVSRKFYPIRHPNKYFPDGDGVWCEDRWLRRLSMQRSGQKSQIEDQVINVFRSRKILLHLNNLGHTRYPIKWYPLPSCRGYNHARRSEHLYLLSYSWRIDLIGLARLAL